MGKEVKKTGQIMGSNITVTWTVVEPNSVTADDHPGPSLLSALFMLSLLSSPLSPLYSPFSVLSSLPALSPLPPHLTHLTCTSARMATRGRFGPSIEPFLQAALFGASIYI